MARRGAAKAGAGRTRAPAPQRTPRFREAVLAPEQEARLAQGRLLDDSRMRALWPLLTKSQQNTAHDPRAAVGHRYPLSSSEVAELTGISQKKVQRWADHKLIPCWRKGRQRMFEAVGLLVAFSFANSKQNDLQFYRELADAPVKKLTEKMSLLTCVLETRLEKASPAEAERINEMLADLAQH